MKNIILLGIVMLLTLASYAQHSLTIKVIEEHDEEPLPGASILLRPLGLSAVADQNGRVILEDIPTGTYILEVRYVGYERYSRSITIDSDLSLIIALEHDHESLEEVVISSTRSTRSIASIPTRVEFIGGEELEEKAYMRPGDIRFVLNESTGIMTQITSALSANASIRIQGLDGRYTQLLKDGFPLYSGAASGLGLLQIPPLDLKQVEVIKGSSSTLYGGGAIAGLVNLISRTPEEEPELEILLNGTSGKGLDISGFYAEKFEKFGLTTYAALNRNAPYDPSDLGLTAIPEFNRFTLNPRLFFSPSKRSELIVGVNATLEERTGGQLAFFEEANSSAYFERNETERHSTQLSFKQQLANGSHLQIKNSLNFFRRDLTTPLHQFIGNQFSTFSEVNYSTSSATSEWILGANVWTEQFNELLVQPGRDRSFNMNVGGVFVQNTVDLSEKFILESGLRLDAVENYGVVALPKLNMFYKDPISGFSSRLGGGLGYKAPTLFTEEAERLQYQSIAPLSVTDLRLERSYGFNWDFDYKTEIGEDWSLSINQLFFYTRIDNPLLLEKKEANQPYAFRSGSGFVNTKGMETNLVIGYEDHFRWVLGYTYTDAQLQSNAGRMENPLTPRNRINSVLMYEKHGEGRIGFESYYYSPQRLSDGAIGQSFWLLGVMAEKTFGSFSVFLNFENFLDTRQTRFDTIFTGDVSRPQFRDIYAPLEGFIMNGGVKIQLL